MIACSFYHDNSKSLSSSGVQRAIHSGLALSVVSVYEHPKFWVLKLTPLIYCSINCVVLVRISLLARVLHFFKMMIIWLHKYSLELKLWVKKTKFRSYFLGGFRWLAIIQLSFRFLPFFFLISVFSFSAFTILSFSIKKEKQERKLVIETRRHLNLNFSFVGCFLNLNS